MGRQGNGKLISAGHKSGTRTAGLFSARPALKKLLGETLMKEIKTVEVKNSGAQKKRRRDAERAGQKSARTRKAARRAEAPQPPPIPVSQLADPGITQPPPEPIHAPHPPMLFECAWEVCWQLGGIYTVLRSKAAAMQTRSGDNYCLIGPYNPATAAMEFEERATEGIVREVLDRLRNQGISCHYGRWLIPGRPRVILLDYRGRFGRLYEDKYL